MTNKDILNAMGNIDPKLILDAEPSKRRETIEKKQVKTIRARWGMVAASFVIFAMTIWGIGDWLLERQSGNKFPDNHMVGEVPNNIDKPTITSSPVDKQAYYTAEELQNFFDMRKNDAVATSYYTEVFVPSMEYLKISSILTEETIAIYEKKELPQTLDEETFTEFLDAIAPKLLNAVGESIHPYEIEKHSMALLGDYLEVSLNGKSQLRKYFVQAEQTEEFHTVTLSSWAEMLNPTRSISLDGVKVEVDQTKPDADILQSLEIIKEKLFTIFGVDFADAKIVRKYGGDSEYGVNWLHVFFYDENAHPLNAMSETPVSDYIRLVFDNFANTEADILSDSILQNVTISYRQNRVSVKESYVESKKLNRISLDEAEEMLAKGYVFGGHFCSFCMQAQEAVSFDGYDKVGMIYVMGRDDKGKQTESVPFYVFYKYIKDAENGNQVYAKTLVPAISVSGCEEFFEKQKQHHNLETFLKEETK